MMHEQVAGGQTSMFARAIVSLRFATSLNKCYRIDIVAQCSLPINEHVFTRLGGLLTKSMILREHQSEIS